MNRSSMDKDKELKHQHDAFLDDSRPTDSLLAKMWDIGHVSRKKAASKPPALEKPTTTPSPKSAEPVQRTLPLETRMRAAARDIRAFDDAEMFTEYPIRPNKEFPTLLTRLPIFRPSRRTTQQQVQDVDNAVAFETPWGSGRRHGPPLTTRDEDTLIALSLLRSRGLYGPSQHLPENVRDIFQAKNGRSDVHRVTCTINQINEFLGLSDGGKNFKNTLASIKRLNACKIEIENVQIDGSRVGGSFDLVKIRWSVYDQHGLIDAVFPPLMSEWLMHSYTYLDWDVRRHLTPLAKALHRFLSGQRRDYTISLIKLASTIGYDGRVNQMKTLISNALNELVEQEWLTQVEITGSGRAVPFKVRTVRK